VSKLILAVEDQEDNMQILRDLLTNLVMKSSRLRMGRRR